MELHTVGAIDEHDYADGALGNWLTDAWNKLKDIYQQVETAVHKADTAIQSGGQVVGTSPVPGAGATYGNLAAEYSENATAYSRAVAGHQFAFQLLKYRSGRYGTLDAAQSQAVWMDTFPGGTSATVTGWGQAIAPYGNSQSRDDAWNKYTQALAHYGLSPDETPDGSGATPGSVVGFTKVVGASGAPGAQPLPGVKVTGAMNYAPLLLLGGVALFAMSKARGRRGG